MKRLAHIIIWILLGALAIVLLLWALSFVPMPVNVFAIVRALVIVVVIVLVLGAILKGLDPLKWE